ncbi:hypothetical protein I4U23_000393 [Adineta vaga]|nr:hypothetical protein I4U23_000393 [Adineta vaga]
MVDDEKRENLANARRKLKKFRDQQQPNENETNGNNGHPSNGSTVDSIVNHNIIPQSVPFNGTHQNIPDINIDKQKEQNHQSGLVIENPKQDKIRLENQRLSSGGSTMSRLSSQTSVDFEQKLRRDNEHLQEQLEMHMQTIGILVAEKTDISAKLTQSFKQLERKQSEMDELYGRLKASRERVQELEKQMQNSTSNVQKREMAAKESDKENDRLKIENIRQSQLIEDLKQNINELNGKLSDRENHIERLNIELQQLNKQSQSTLVEQQTIELQQTLTMKNNQIEELSSSINRIRSDNEQYQKYNTDMQHHIQDLTNQINQLTETNQVLQNHQNELRLTDRSSVLEHDNLQQENQLFRNAIDQWSNRYEDLRIKLEQMAKLLTEKDEQIAELKQIIDQSKDSNNEFQSNEYIDLKTQLQSMQDTNQQLTERLEEIKSRQTNSIVSSDSINDQELLQNYHRVIDENAQLNDRIQELDHVILQLQSETDTIGDYIRLYQQQREQLQKRYQEKDDSITQLTQDRLNLQKKISELEILIIQFLNIPITPTEFPESSETIDCSLTSDKTTSLSHLRQTNVSVRQNNSLSTVKLAFVDTNIYICSTCSGSVQSV